MFECHMNQSMHHVCVESTSAGVTADALSKNVAVPHLKISLVMLTL